MNCPKCNKPLKARTGKYGDFMGCTGYPECKYVFKEKTGGYPEPPPQPQNSPAKPSEVQNRELVLLEAIDGINRRLDKMAEFLVEKLGTDEKEEVSVKDIKF